MEGYFNVSGAHNAFDDFDIEGKKSFDIVEKNHMNFSPQVGFILLAIYKTKLSFLYSAPLCVFFFLLIIACGEEEF